MASPTFFRSLRAGGLLVSLASLGSFAAACNGRVISLGSTGDSLQPIQGGTSAAGTTPIACPSGWAHPNVCCTAAANSSPACGAWEESPFRACDPGTTTYPDPLSCCSLSDPKNCTDNPSAPVTTPPPAWGCGYTCPPGWWEQAAGENVPGVTSTTMCCEARTGEVPLCVPVPTSTASAPPVACGTTSSGGGTLGTADAGGPVANDSGVPFPSAPPSEDDAGAPIEPGDDAGCGETAPAFPNYDGGAASLCGACPTGWTADGLQPELCCQDANDGTRLCFSQASGSVTATASVGAPPEIDASSPSSEWGAGGGGPDGGPAVSCWGNDNTCACDDTVNGHAYALDCSSTQANGVATCSCLVDGVSVGTTTVDSCQDSNAVTGAYSTPTGCGFP
jgi:hypothetical protein